MSAGRERETGGRGPAGTGPVEAQTGPVETGRVEPETGPVEVEAGSAGTETRPPAVGGFERVNPPELAPPTGFSHAVRAAPGTIVFLAGQTALDGTGRIVGAGIVEQFERALTNLLAAARAAGAGPGDLAKLTVFAVDVADYRGNAAAIGRVWKRLVGADYPAMAVIGATRLWDEAALVEIEGCAVVR